MLICTAHTGTLGKEGILILLFSYSSPPASHLCSPKGRKDKALSVALPGSRNLWIQPIARMPGMAKVLKTRSVPVYPPPHPQLWPRRQFSSKHHHLLGETSLSSSPPLPWPSGLPLGHILHSVPVAYSSGVQAGRQS